MQFDPMLTGIVVIVAALVVISLFIWMGARRRKERHLRDRFGNEYDRTVEAKGSRSAAEHDLRERERMAQSLKIQSLSRDQRERYATEWERIEARFVERPTTAVMEADEMMQEVLRQKGYPIRSFDGLVADLSVHQPELVDDFRAAHDVIDRDDPGDLNTEELRKAMLHYRNIFDNLIGAVPRFESSAARDTEVPIQSVRETDDNEDAADVRKRPNIDRPDDRPRLR